MWIEIQRFVAREAADSAGVIPTDGYLVSPPAVTGLADVFLVHLESGSDRRYVGLVRRSLEVAAQAWRPGTIVIYNAGVDPVNVVSFDDPMETIASREDFVMEFVQDKPAVFTLAGGYKWSGFTEDDISTLHHEMVWRWASPVWLG